MCKNLPTERRYEILKRLAVYYNLFYLTTQEVRSHQQFQCNFGCRREFGNLGGALSIATLQVKYVHTLDSTCKGISLKLTSFSANFPGPLNMAFSDPNVNACSLFTINSWPSEDISDTHGVRAFTATVGFLPTIYYVLTKFYLIPQELQQLLTSSAATTTVSPHTGTSTIQHPPPTRPRHFGDASTRG